MYFRGQTWILWRVWIESWIGLRHRLCPQICGKKFFDFEMESFTSFSLTDSIWILLSWSAPVPAIQLSLMAKTSHSLCPSLADSEMWMTLSPRSKKNHLFLNLDSFWPTNWIPNFNLKNHWITRGGATYNCPDRFSLQNVPRTLVLYLLKNTIYRR